MNKAYLLIGGNMGDRATYMQQAIELLNSTCGFVNGQSALYETEAWGQTNQAPFINQALELHTHLTAPQLMTEILLVEEQMGRKRGIKYGARVIDIDILLFNDELHDTGHISIPHPELPNRRFALIPLAEIAAGYVHPVLQKTIAALLLECPDTLNVKKISE